MGIGKFNICGDNLGGGTEKKGKRVLPELWSFLALDDLVQHCKHLLELERHSLVIKH